MDINEALKQQGQQGQQSAVSSASREVATLVPTKSDADVAAEFKKEAETALLGLCQIMDRANRAGFVLQFQLGTVPPGKNIVSTLFLAKHY